MKKYALPAFLFVALGIVLVVVFPRLFRASTSLTDEADHDQLLGGPGSRPLRIVGESFPPYEFLSGNGAATGINIEVLAQALGELDIHYNVQLYSWPKAVWMVEHGKADALISVSYTKDREQFLIYTPDQKQFGKDGAWPENYFWKTEYVFFVANDKVGKVAFNSFEQLEKDKLRIGTLRGYSYCPEFREAKLDKVTCETIEQGMTALVKGNIDLFPMDRTVGLAKLKECGLLDKVSSLPKPIFTKPYLFCFGKASTFPGKKIVIRKIYDKIKAMRKSDEYDTIYRRYTAQ